MCRESDSECLPNDGLFFVLLAEWIGRLRQQRPETGDDRRGQPPDAEAEDIATDLLKERGWFAEEEPLPPDYVP